VALVILVLVAAVAVGLAAGGPVGSKEEPVRGWPLLLLAVLAQAGGALFGVPGYRVGLVLSAALAGGFLAANRRLAGVPLVTLGLLLNALVVTANAAMPVSRYAAARAGVDFATAVPAGDPRHEAADRRTRLAALGDVVPLPLPPRREVVSPGDCLLAAGLALLVLRGVRPREKVVGNPGRSPSGQKVT
jgi:hypothetical protein